MCTNKNKKKVEDWFETLRNQICKSFEEIEDQFEHKLIKQKPGKFKKKNGEDYKITKVVEEKFL